jgi:selenocysteine-specific elongation factor
MRGHGAVVTGTLIAGTLRIHEELALYPTGKRVRVRGLQVHGAPVERAEAGERTAVNLAGIDTSEARRGMVLAPAGLFRTTCHLDTLFELLPGARPLKHRAPVHLHAGTAEVEAEARLLSTSDPDATRAHVRFLLRDPLLLLPGDRFIVRKFSPVVTIGGGIVLDITAPARMRRADLARRLATLENSTAAGRVELLVAESKYGMSIAELVARTGLAVSEIRAAAESQALFFVPDPHSWTASRTWADQILARFREILKDFHRRNPLLPGLAKEQLRSRELAGAPAFLLDAVIARAKDVVAEGEIVRLTSHRVALKQDEEAATGKIEALFREAGLSVPSTPEVLAKSGVESARGRTLLQILLKDRKLIRVGDELIYHASAIETLRQTLKSRKGQRFSVAEFKDWTGVSRKYAIPLLEFLDRERVTRREGEARIVI